MPTTTQNTNVFAAARAAFEEILGFLSGESAAAMTHAELEERLATDGRQLLRQLYQDHLDLRCLREVRLATLTDKEGVVYRYAEKGHSRPLTSIFGEVTHTRCAYRRKGQANLYPADGALNLPDERYSHGVRRLAAVEVSRGSYEDTQEAIKAHTGVQVGRRQLENLVLSAVVDFEAFHAGRNRPVAEEDEVVVISADGKGIVMRPEGLRVATAAKAARSENKLKGRLSRGEKANRKRMAEVGAVYTINPVPRSPADVMTRSDGTKPKEAPRAEAKWVTASVDQDAAAVIAGVFDEAERRDPTHRCRWVALVDGLCGQRDYAACVAPAA